MKVRVLKVRRTYNPIHYLESDDPMFGGATRWVAIVEVDGKKYKVPLTKKDLEDQERLMQVIKRTIEMKREEEEEKKRRREVKEKIKGHVFEL